MKEKRRYVFSNIPLKEWLTSQIGYTGISQHGVKFLSKHIIRVNLSSLQLILGVIALNKDAKIILTSGTLKKLKEKVEKWKNSTEKS